jgi:hypothetical protein
MALAAVGSGGQGGQPIAAQTQARTKALLAVTRDSCPFNKENGHVADRKLRNWQRQEKRQAQER